MFAEDVSQFFDRGEFAVEAVFTRGTPAVEVARASVIFNDPSHEVQFGQAAGDASTSQAVLGSDTRLTDARAPLSHTHTTAALTDHVPWTAVSFNGSHYTASGGGTWAVEAGDLITLRHTITGKVMTVSFSFFTTTIAGGPLELYFPIPAGKTATARMGNRLGISIENGAANTDGSVKVTAGGTQIALYKTSGAAWANGANNNYFEGQITFQID